jgi:hypothetical protein
MRLPDGTILMHGRAPYDPVKAHEYYIRTRKLKGRKPAAWKPVASKRRLGSPSVTVRLPSGKTVKLSQQQLIEQRAQITARINDIKKNLAKLTTELRVRMREAQNKKAKAEAEAKKLPTAAEKSKAAREAKQYRAKNKQTLSNKAKATTQKESKPEADPVAELQGKIDDVKSKLSAAVAHQRSLMAATKPATKGR